MDYEIILSSKFICDNDFISQLRAKIFVIYEWSIDKYKELSGGEINRHVK